MAISLIFSGLLYKVSAAELEHSVNRQIGYFNNFLTQDDVYKYSIMRQHQLDEDKGRLKTNLVVFNVLVLGAGGIVSYWLARRTLEPIEAALEAQSRFAGDASHELRTPLTAIQAENEVALRNPNLTKSQAVDLLKSNLEEVAKLKSLSDGLLRLANDSGQLDNPQPVKLKDVVTAAADRYQKTAGHKHITLSYKAADVSVRGDQDSLVELVAVLVDNAIKYSPPKTKVSISASRQGKDALIKVADQGQGIPSVELAQIFERFYRGDGSRAKDSTGGYGLGLAIAKQIAVLHNGHIDVASTPQKGSTFTVHLPAA
ncbi:HAMP domain-containing histidine kinase [Candidatus Saccharibacteria bacterium]|nr:HAMP domain-containing histidine kinase [Candidatus Saccharibacteria bacterium]